MPNLLKSNLFTLAFIFTVGLLIGFSIGLFIKLGIWGYLNSNFLSAISPIIAAIILIYLGLNQFYIQQRVNNLRKIYFEETFLATIKNLERTIQSSKYIMSSLEEMFNMTIDFISQKIVDKKILINSIVDIREHIFRPIEFSEIPKQRLEEIFSKKGHKLIQWIEKSEKDFMHFSGASRERLIIFINDLATASRRSRNRDQILVARLTNDMKCLHRLVIRHYALIVLFSKFISKFNILRYRSIMELKSFVENKEILLILDEIDKIYLTLFAYYKPKNKKDKAIYSYAKDENGNRFKIIKKNNMLKIRRTKINKQELDEMIIYEDEKLFAYSIIEDTRNNYIKSIIGLGNIILYGERPDFIKEIKSI